MTLFYIPNPTQCLNLTATLLNINKQKIDNLLRERSWLIVNKCSIFYSINDTDLFFLYGIV